MKKGTVKKCCGDWEQRVFEKLNCETCGRYEYGVRGGLKYTRVRFTSEGWTCPKRKEGT